MVAADLPQFCHLMQLLLFLVPSPSKLVTDTEGLPNASVPLMKAETFTKAEKFVRTKIQFQTEDLPAHHASKLLKPLRNMIHGSEKVTILNYNDTLVAEVRDLGGIMGPKTVWLKAMVRNI